MIDTAWYNI